MSKKLIVLLVASIFVCNQVVAYVRIGQAFVRVQNPLQVLDNEIRVTREIHNITVEADRAITQSNQGPLTFYRERFAGLFGERFTSTLGAILHAFVRRPGR